MMGGPREFKPELITVRIDRCRHYNGYKYGSSSFNPYENYVVGIHRKVDRRRLRETFEDFLRFFRPRHFGELLQLQLAQPVPMWVYPWDPPPAFRPNGGWVDDAESVPDIITHFCEAGIPRSKIDLEYFWLERAYETIATAGYLPGRFTYITVRELRRGGESVFVVKDGNHRLSALTALGHREAVVARDARETVDASHVSSWPQVVSGLYSASEAMAVCDVYFRGISTFARAPKPATILDEPECVASR